MIIASENYLFGAVQKINVFVTAINNQSLTQSSRLAIAISPRSLKLNTCYTFCTPKLVA